MVIGVFTLSGSSPARAQSVRGSFGFFQLGYFNAPQSGAVAQTFAPDWFPHLNDHFIYSGAEGWLRRNRFMAGLSASALTARSVSVQQTRVERVTGMGQLKISYVLFDNRRWLLYSAVGRGISSSLITVHQNGSEPVIWMLPTHSTDLSLHMNRLLVSERSAEPTAVRGLWLGLRIGYVVSAKSAHWQQIPEGQPTQFKPEYALNGLYFTLTIGGGGFQYSPSSRQ
ncbi:hypothetical protein EHT87_06760 [Larkinella knui]|uniref:Outer membrane protein beta-barrel domain-containing protein n=1 Tax=Larkinella knui TaxID=2025310 RepID=A0A3P1CXL8_9BACT|nr:hypothetical protein EHT87_06760 [Larkinella knui]